MAEAEANKNRSGGECAASSSTTKKTRNMESIKPLFQLIIEEASKNPGNPHPSASPSAPSPPPLAPRSSWRRHFSLPKTKKRAKNLWDDVDDGIQISSPVFAVRSKLQQLNLHMLRGGSSGCTSAAAHEASSPPPLSHRRHHRARSQTSLTADGAAAAAQDQYSYPKKNVHIVASAGIACGVDAHHGGFSDTPTTKKRGGAELDDSRSYSSVATECIDNKRDLDRCVDVGGRNGHHDDSWPPSSTATDACMDRGRSDAGGEAAATTASLMSDGGWPCRLRLGGGERRSMSFSESTGKSGQENDVLILDVYKDCAKECSKTPKEEAAAAAVEAKEEEEGCGDLDLYPHLQAATRTRNATVGFRKATTGGGEAAAMSGGGDGRSCLEGDGEEWLEMAMGVDLMVLRAKVERDMALAEALQLRLALDEARQQLRREIQQRDVWAKALHLNYQLWDAAARQHFYERCCWQNWCAAAQISGAGAAPPPPPPPNKSAASHTHHHVHHLSN